MPDLPIQIVDEHDKPISSATKQEAWAQGLVHRAVRVMIEDGKGNVLVQKRADGKELFPGCWDTSAAGHVDAGETYEQAMERELAEELGLTNQPLKKQGDYYIDETWKGRRMKKFCRSYKLVQPDLPPLSLPPEEVSEVRWMSIQEVKQLIADHPDHVSDGLRQVFERFYA